MGGVDNGFVIIEIKVTHAIKKVKAELQKLLDTQVKYIYSMGAIFPFCPPSPEIITNLV